MTISNVTALKKDVAAHKTAPLDDVVQAINISLGLSVTADNKARHCRLDAGRMLVELRRRVEGDGTNDWWTWQEGKFTRSRKDIEKLMRMASADDPEAAVEQERAEGRQRKARSRSNGADVRSKPEAPAATQAPAAGAVILPFTPRDDGSDDDDGRDIDHDVDLNDPDVCAGVIYTSISNIDGAKTTPEAFWAKFGSPNGIESTTRWLDSALETLAAIRRGRPIDGPTLIEAEVATLG